MPSQTQIKTERNIFYREIKVNSKTIKLEQVIEGDVHCVVWDASLVLSKFLEKQTIKWNGLNIIELGSGLGCVGLSAACLGANVILSDLTEALPLLEKNINNNLEVIRWAKGSAVAKVINWGDDFTDFINTKPDFILVADCVYYSEAVKKLVKTLVDLSGKDTIIYVSQEERDSIKQKTIWNQFLSLIDDFFHFMEIPFSEQHSEFRSHDIKLLQLKLKY